MVAMSARISQILEVVEEVRSKHQSTSSPRPISEIRIDAVRSVAGRRDITTNSVADKFIRQLAPEVTSTSQFDSLLKEWLIDGSRKLRDIVLKHAVDNKDREMIASAFHIAPTKDVLLAEEFGLDASDPLFEEGREFLRIHLAKERNRHLVALAKDLWLRNGDLKCAICSFSFLETYGEAGDGYIEAHHVTPISQLSESTIVRPSDLAPVCSNCHGIIHRHKPWLTIEEMKAIVVKRSIGKQ